MIVLPRLSLTGASPRRGVATLSRPARAFRRRRPGARGHLGERGFRLHQKDRTRIVIILSIYVREGAVSAARANGPRALPVRQGAAGAAVPRPASTTLLATGRRRM